MPLASAFHQGDRMQSTSCRCQPRSLSTSALPPRIIPNDNRYETSSSSLAILLALNVIPSRRHSSRKALHRRTANTFPKSQKSRDNGEKETHPENEHIQSTHEKNVFRATQSISVWEKRREASATHISVYLPAHTCLPAALSTISFASAPPPSSLISSTADHSQNTFPAFDSRNGACSDERGTGCQYADILALRLVYCHVGVSLCPFPSPLSPPPFPILPLSFFLPLTLLLLPTFPFPSPAFSLSSLFPSHPLSFPYSSPTPSSFPSPYSSPSPSPYSLPPSLYLPPTPPSTIPLSLLFLCPPYSQFPVPTLLNPSSSPCPSPSLLPLLPFLPPLFPLPFVPHPPSPALLPLLFPTLPPCPSPSLLPPALPFPLHPASPLFHLPFLPCPPLPPCPSCPLLLLPPAPPPPPFASLPFHVPASGETRAVSSCLTSLRGY
ncbi:hypothetical protein C7M84_021251 [Penaeus vannamei]|uniref:Uncharacterized protein n=1 Tax=Penaeus vannamei TaxID=6689 RepID=A0A3R7PC21_PENVA|nr:hypothetical protein C7M84_021251 [Penaeus vannamei]